MVRQIMAFLRGMWEFRKSLTWFGGYETEEAYDRGREFAHLITFRRWDH